MKKISVKRDILLFLRKPDYLKFSHISKKEKITIVSKVFLYTFLGLFILNIPIEGLKKLGVINEIVMKTNNALKMIPPGFNS